MYPAFTSLVEFPSIAFSCLPGFTLTEEKLDLKYSFHNSANSESELFFCIDFVSVALLLFTVSSALPSVSINTAALPKQPLSFSLFPTPAPKLSGAKIVRISQRALG